MLEKLLRIGQVLNVVGVIAILGIAFFYQYAFYELPCPVCLLQRLGFIGIGLGYLLNLHNGFRSSHYAITYLSALYILISSQLQIFLHIAPGNAGYGDPILGLHLYTWGYIAALYFIFSTSLFLIIDQQFNETSLKTAPRLTSIISYCFVVIVLVNAVSVFLECGFKLCPGNPVHYMLLQ